jgi:hypothetical protein
MAESDSLLSAFEDGFGARMADTDPASGDALERLYVSNTFKTVVEQLRERTGRLTNLRHIRFARLRSIERERDKDKRLYIVADATPGIRLARVLQFTQMLGLTVDADTVIHVLRELLPALALLHDSRSVTHGAVGPERLLVTDKGRVVVGDHMFGSALDKLRLSRARLWQDLRVPMPPAAGVPRFDKRSDVSQVGMVALAMLLGRPLSDEEFPTRIPTLLDSLTETHRGGHTERLSKELRAWLERALPIDARKPFLATKEAQAALEDVVAGRKAYSPNSAALKAFVARFLTEFSRRVPAPPGTVTPSPAEPERMPQTVVFPEDAALPATADLQKEPDVSPAWPVATDVAGDVGAEAARASESVEGQPVPPPEAPPTAQKPTVAEPAPKRRGGSKKKPPAQAWHPSIDETEAEEIRRLEAELSRLAALEADSSAVAAGPAVPSSAESDSEHVIEQVIDLDCALDLLADEAAPGNDDGAWVLEVSAAATDGALAASDPSIDIGDAFALESNFGAVSPTVGTAEPLDILLNADPPDGLVVEHFGIAPVQIEPREPEPDEHALSLVDLVTVDETAASPSPAAPVPERSVEVDPHTGETVRDTDGVQPAEPIDAMGEDVGDEAVAIELEEDDVDRFELTPPDAVAVAQERAALVEAERWPQAELDFECEAVECEEPVDDGFVLVPWTPLAVDSDSSSAGERDEVAQLACDDLTPRLPFESADAVICDDAPDAVDAGPAPDVAAVDPCPAPETLAQPLSQVAQPVSEEWLATGTDGPSGHSFNGPLAFDAVGRARSRRLERDLGGFDQPRVWSVPTRWRAPEAETSGPNSLEDGDLQADPPDAAADSRLTDAAVPSSFHERTFATEPEAEPAATIATECALTPVLATPFALPQEPAASLTSTGASDAPPVEALVSPITTGEACSLDADIGAAPADASHAGLGSVVPADGPPPVEGDTGHETPLVAEPDLQAGANAPLDLPAADVHTRRMAGTIPLEPEVALASDSEALPALPLAAEIEAEPTRDSIYTIEHARVAEVDSPPDPLSAPLAEPEPDPALSVAFETAPPEATLPIALASEPALEPAPPIAVATEREPGALPSTVGESEAAREPAPALETAPAASIEIAATVESELALSREAPPTAIMSSAVFAPPTADVPAARAALVFDPSLEAESEGDPDPEPDRRFALPSEPAPAEGPAHEPRPETESGAVREAALEARAGARAEAEAEAVPEVEHVSSAENADLSAVDESVDGPVADDEPDSSAASGTTADASAAATPTVRASKRSRRRKKKASGESLMRRSSFAPVRIERPPMPAPPWLRGKTAAVPGEGEVAPPQMSAPTASSSSALALSTPSPTLQVLEPTGANHGEVHGPAAAASPTAVVLQVEHQGVGLTQAVHAAPLRAVSSRLTLSFGRLAALVLVGLLVEAVLLGGWAVMSRPDTTGRLLIVTRPKGIRVMVDGTVVGDTPYGAPVAPGKHAIQLTGRSITRTLEIDVPPSAQGGAFVRWPTEAARGSVTISSVPDGARVSIDGEEQGMAPVTVHDLIAGPHTVTVTGKRGSVETTVDVKADRTVSLEVPIYSGWVSVFSAVPLDISENTKLLGNTESDRIMLGAGAHTLELSNVSLGYRETRTVQVVPGKVVPVSVELPTAPLFIDVEPGAEIWVDGERVGYTPAMDLRAPIGTRVILLKREGQPDERHVVSVRLPGPTRVGPTQP